jgi:hypothetical protein
MVFKERKSDEQANSDHIGGNVSQRQSQQQLMGNAALERYFHIFILVYHPQHGYDF